VRPAGCQGHQQQRTDDGQEKRCAEHGPIAREGYGHGNSITREAQGRVYRFAHHSWRDCARLALVSTSSSTTVDVVAPQPFATPVEATRVLDQKRPRSAAVRQLRRALDVIADLGTLVLMAWLVPFVVLAIASPIVLILWAALALIRRL